MSKGDDLLQMRLKFKCQNKKQYFVTGDQFIGNNGYGCFKYTIATVGLLVQSKIS